MKVQMQDGRVYNLFIRHIRGDELEKKDRRRYNAITEAVIVDDKEQTVAKGVAHCAKGDTFVRRKGINVAMQFALPHKPDPERGVTVKFGKEERKKFWERVAQKKPAGTAV